MSEKVKEIIRHPFIIIGGIFLILAFAFFNGSATLHDTTTYFYFILFNGELPVTQDYRDFGINSLQLPFFLYFKFINKNFYDAINIYQLTILYFPLVLVVFNYFTLEKSRKNFIFLHIAIMCITYLFSFFLHVTELNLAIGFLCIALLNLDQYSKRHSVLLSITSLILSSFAYPIYTILSPVIFIWILTSVKEKMIKVIYILTNMFIFTFSVYTTYLYFKHAESNTLDIFNIYQNKGYLGFVVFTYFIIFVSAINNYKGQMKFFVNSILIIFSSYFIIHYEIFGFWMHFDGRMVAFGTLLPLTILLLFYKNTALISIARNLSLVSIFILLAYNIRFYIPKSQVTKLLEQNHGIIQLEKLPKKDQHSLLRIFSDFSLTETLFLMTKKDHPITTIVFFEFDGAFADHAPRKRLASTKSFLKKMQTYGVIYSEKIQQQIEQISDETKL